MRLMANRLIGITVLCLTVVALVAAQEAPKAPPSIAGKWTLTLVTDNFTATPTLDLKVDGEKADRHLHGPLRIVPARGYAQGPRARVRVHDERRGHGDR